MVHQVRSSVIGSSARGFFCARDSSNRSATSSSVPAPNTANAISAMRQPRYCASRPPSGALAQAITPRPVRPLDMMRAPSTGA
ncbi:hypothetical protein D9M69_651280 [compost metagenome]